MRRGLVLLAVALLTLCRVAGAECDTHEELKKSRNWAETCSNFERRLQEDAGNHCLHYGLGLCASRQAQYDRALDHFHTAIQLDPQYPRSYIEAGWIHHARRDYEPAREFFEKAINVAKETNEPMAEADAMARLADLHLRDYGSPEPALKYLNEAARLSGARSDNEARALRARVQLRKAEALRDLGEFSEAKKSCREVIAIRQELNNLALWNAYNVLGDIHLASGDAADDLGRAEREYQDAIASYERARATALAPEDRQRLLIWLGDAHLKHGDQEKALAYYESFLNGLPKKNAGFKEEHSRAWGGIGEIYLQRGDYDRALIYLQRAVDLAREDKYKRLELSWLKRIGDAYAGTGDDDKARAYYDAVWSAIKDGFLDLGSQPKDERYLFFEDEFAAHEALVDLLLKQGRAQEGFDYMEWARTQSVLQTLFQSQAIVEKLLQGTARDQFRERMKRLQDTAQSMHQIKLELQNQDLGKNKRLAEEMERLDAHIGDLYKQIVNLVRAELRNYPMVNLVEKLQKEALKDDEVLVEYMVTDDKTFVFLITKDTLRYEVIPIGGKGYRITPAGTKEAVTSLKQLMRDVSPGLFPRPGEDASNGTRIDAIAANIQLGALHDLYEAIFRPLEKHLRPEQQLIIVPDDVLYYLPFEMLVTGYEPSGAPTYLLSRYPISYAYSTNFLLQLPVATAGRSQTSLLIGNPDFGAAAQATDELAARLRTSRFFPGGRLDQLPYAQEEVNRIRKVIAGAEALLGAQATEAAFKRKASGAAIIHIATHSFFNRRNYLESPIFFAQGARVDQQGEDGVLYLHEIMNLKLQALLVVLTGCETGLGRLRRGGGLEGVSRAFLSAGVPSVVGTLWPVADSEATSKLMDRFYRNLARGMDKRSALQKAKLDLTVEDPYINPFLWAAPILIGDPHAVALPENRRSWLTALFPLLLVLAVLFYLAVRVIPR